MSELWAGLDPPYRTIVADPPWPDEHKLTGVTRVGRVKKERGIEAHYSTLTMADIAALPVGLLAEDDAHLYLWTTNLHLEQTYAIMDAWGFSYRSMLTWCKTGHLGLGHYFRTNTEHVLFGIRGSLRTLDRHQGTYFTAAKQGHSVKPSAFGDLVERCSPGPYVELFARAPRLGWDSWGHGFEARPGLQGDGESHETEPGGDESPPDERVRDAGRGADDDHEPDDDGGEAGQEGDHPAG